MDLERIVYIYIKPWQSTVFPSLISRTVSVDVKHHVYLVHCFSLCLSVSFSLCLSPAPALSLSLCGERGGREGGDGECGRW